MKVIAHRGASAFAPENTMSAFTTAQSMGADGIEFDVRSTSDGQLVVTHDASLDRTTNGTGLVVETTSAEIAKLDAGSWYAEKFTGERVPRLHEVLELVGLEFELELKGYGNAFLEAVLETVDRVCPTGRVEFTSSNVLLLARLKQHRPTARTGLFTRRPSPTTSPAMFEYDVIGTAETSGVDVVHVYSGAITSRIADRLRASGFEVHANDADSEQLLRNAFDVGADRVTTNDIGTAVAIRNPKPA